MPSPIPRDVSLRPRSERLRALVRNEHDWRYLYNYLETDEAAHLQSLLEVNDA